MLGNNVVTTPAMFAVEPIDIDVPAIPMNVESGVYVNSSFVLKKLIIMKLLLILMERIQQFLKHMLILNQD